MQDRSFNWHGSKKYILILDHVNIISTFFTSSNFSQHVSFNEDGGAGSNKLQINPPPPNR